MDPLKPTFHIVIGHFLNDPSGDRVIGGVETYVANLIRVLRGAGYQTAVYQFAAVSFNARWEGTEVHALADARRSAKTLVNAAALAGNPERDVLLFATDFLLTKHRFRRAVAVQHGVAWDLPGSGSEAENYRRMISNVPRTLRKYRRFRYCSDLVCVDYNFLNWYRTQVACFPQRLHVIPNFARPVEPAPMAERGLSVLFARRFVSYRGTRLLASVLDALLRDYGVLRVTLAGEGPDEAWLRAHFAHEPRVRITRYAPEESGEIHRAHAIAVIPTTGSEGTSLSLLEAMAAGCAPVATNVGGMTNILLDGYNGLMVPPQEAALERALRTLLDDAALREKLAAKAQETVSEAFSFQRWQQKWLELIESL